MYKKNDGISENDKLQNRFSSYVSMSIHRERIVPFVYRGIMRCAVMGYTQSDGEDSLRPVLYDIRDSYNHEDLEKYLKEYRYQGIIVPEVTYRVHCLSKNKQNISFQSLITGQYKPASRKTLQRYYIDLKELNALFKD